MPWPNAPPSYNHRYGFRDGAQLDIFGEVDKTACQDDEAVLTQADNSAPDDVAVDASEAVQDVAGYLPQSTAHAQAPWSAGRDSADEQSGSHDTPGDAMLMHAEVDRDSHGDQAHMAAATAPGVPFPAGHGHEELSDRSTFPDRHIVPRYTAELR
jgi:hypothetical protein